MKKNSKISARKITVCAVLSALSAIVSAVGVNIDNLLNKSKGDYAYTMIDCNEDIGDRVVEALKAVDGVLRVRCIR